MGAVTQEEWRARLKSVKYAKLHDGVAVISGKVVLAPWLKMHLP